MIRSILRWDRYGTIHFPYSGSKKIAKRGRKEGKEEAGRLHTAVFPVPCLPAIREYQRTSLRQVLLFFFFSIFHEQQATASFYLDAPRLLRHEMLVKVSILCKWKDFFFCLSLNFIIIIIYNDLNKQKNLPKRIINKIYDVDEENLLMLINSLI